MHPTQQSLAEHATIPLRIRASCHLIKRRLLDADQLIDESQSRLVLNALADKGINFDERTYRSWWNGTQMPTGSGKSTLQQLAPGCFKYLEFNDLSDPIARNLRIFDVANIDGTLSSQKAIESIPHVTNEIYRIIDRVWEAFYSPRYRPYDDALDIEPQAPGISMRGYFVEGVRDNQNYVDLPAFVKNSYEPGSQLGLLKFLIALSTCSLRTEKTELLKLLSMDLATLSFCIARTLDIQQITTGKDPRAYPMWNEILFLLNSFMRSKENYLFSVTHYCEKERSRVPTLRENPKPLLSKVALSSSLREQYFEQLRDIGISQKFFLATLKLDSKDLRTQA